MQVGSPVVVTNKITTHSCFHLTGGRSIPSKRINKMQFFAIQDPGPLLEMAIIYMFATILTVVVAVFAPPIMHIKSLQMQQAILSSLSKTISILRK